MKLMLAEVLAHITCASVEEIHCTEKSAGSGFLRRAYLQEPSSLYACKRLKMTFSFSLYAGLKRKRTTSRIS
jgi:hypothetical protein